MGTPDASELDATTPVPLSVLGPLLGRLLFVASIALVCLPLLEAAISVVMLFFGGVPTAQLQTLTMKYLSSTRFYFAVGMAGLCLLLSLTAFGIGWVARYVTDADDRNSR